MRRGLEPMFRLRPQHSINYGQDKFRHNNLKPQAFLLPLLRLLTLLRFFFLTRDHPRAPHLPVPSPSFLWHLKPLAPKNQVSCLPGYVSSLDVSMVGEGPPSLLLRVLEL